MWPFKKAKPIESLDDRNHSWSVSQGSNNGAPLLVRINETAKEWRRHQDLSIRLGFAIPLNRPSPGGMPDAEENETLGQIEDVICDSVRNIGKTIHVASITNGTMKEFVFYIHDGGAVAGLHKELQQKITTHDIQCVADYDKQWNVYDGLLPNA